MSPSTGLPPINDTIIHAVARLVDDARTDTREPSHSDIEHCIRQAGLAAGDPKAQGQVVGKEKRVRAVLSWGYESAFDQSRQLIRSLLAMIVSRGGFRETSPNYVGGEPIRDLQDAFAHEGFELTNDGQLRPQVLDTLSGRQLTEALENYVRRARRGATDAALVTGTSKDLLEATAAHVVSECYGGYSSSSNFPTLLGQAFVAVGLKTPHDPAVQGEPPQHRFQRAIYEAACAVNTLRNKQGTGHGRPWLPTVTDDEAKTAIQVMGVVAGMLLDELRKGKP